MYLIENDLSETLNSLGARKHETRLPEVNILSNLLQEGEEIYGSIFGRYRHYLEGLQGRGALVSTNLRLLLIDHQPTTILYEELRYDLIRGLIYFGGKYRSKLSLQTKIGDISITSYNPSTVDKFVNNIDKLITQDQELAMPNSSFFTLGSS